jgi:trans-aconitate methyltransferase
MADERGERIIGEQIAYYRARAEEYDETFAGAHDPELVAALDAARPSGRVLELACGTGAWTRSLLRHPVASILAIDAAPEMLAIHRRRIRDSRVTRQQANLFYWSPPARYDFVTFAFWLSHVPPARFTSFFAMVRDAVAPGGRIFVVDQDERGQRFEEPSSDAEYPTVARPLLDGTVMNAIKVYRSPDAFESSLAPLGWAIRSDRVDRGFFWAEARPV